MSSFFRFIINIILFPFLAVTAVLKVFFWNGSKGHVRGIAVVLVILLGAGGITSGIIFGGSSADSGSASISSDGGDSSGGGSSNTGKGNGGSSGSGNNAAKYTITFYDVDNSKIESKTVSSGSTVSAPNSSYATGYEFDGWYKDKERTSKWVASSAVYSSFSLYLKQKPTIYTISYDLGGGTNDARNVSSGSKSLSYTVESNITLHSASKRNYSFDGWYLDKAYTQKITSIVGMTGNKTIYAKFVARSYSSSIDVTSKTSFTNWDDNKYGNSSTVGTWVKTDTIKYKIEHKGSEASTSSTTGSFNGDVRLTVQPSYSDKSDNYRLQSSKHHYHLSKDTYVMNGQKVGRGMLVIKKNGTIIKTIADCFSSRDSVSVELSEIGSYTIDFYFETHYYYQGFLWIYYDGGYYNHRVSYNLNID